MPGDQLTEPVKAPRFGGVPAWLLSLAGLVVMAVAGLLVYLAVDQWKQDDDCVSADLLSADQCEELHESLGNSFLIAGIAGIAALLLLLLGLRAVGARDARRKKKTPPEPAVDVPDRGEAPVRVCPVCSAQSKTHSDSCPHCGSSFIRARRLRASRQMTGMSALAKIGLAAAILLIPIAGVGAAWGIIASGDRQDDSEELAAAELDRQKEEAAAEAAEKAQAAEDAERALRQIQVRELEDTITKDAQQASEQSFAVIDGPILETQCDPDGGEIDIEAVAQDFDCLAVQKFNDDGTISGYNYSANINYKKFEYRWRLGDGGL